MRLTVIPFVVTVAMATLGACGDSDHEPAPTPFTGSGITVQCVEPDIMRELVGAVLDALRADGRELDDFDFVFAPDNARITAVDPLDAPVLEAAASDQIAASPRYLDCRFEPLDD